MIQKAMAYLVGLSAPNYKENNGILYADKILKEVKPEPGPNPVELIPYETFPEIEGVARKFVFRITKGRNGIECALFESGDTCWKLEYTKRIKAYFEDHLIADPKLDKALSISIIA